MTRLKNPIFSPFGSCVFYTTNNAEHYLQQNKKDSYPVKGITVYNYGD